MFFKAGITQDCTGEALRADPCFRPIFPCLALLKQVCVSPVFFGNFVSLCAPDAVSRSVYVWGAQKKVF
jgi:hypothetical protein